MNRALLRSEVQDFIREHLHADTTSIILKGSPFGDVSAKELAGQIESMSRAEKKLPTWFKTPNIYYPPSLSIEQTSSEVTAAYKASLFQGIHFVDITGGLGVDDLYFARQFKKVDHCEINTALSAIADHNFRQLGIDNISCHPEDGIQFLKTLKSIDMAYADPARRDDHKGKVFLLSDCTPDISVHLKDLLEISTRIMIKTSPMLDLRAGLEQLSHVKEIHIVAVKNEVKELLWVISRCKDQNGSTGDSKDKQAAAQGDNPLIVCVNLDERKPTPEKFSFSLAQLENVTAKTGAVSTYLYEPNAAIMKSGAFGLITQTYNVKKLHPNTHLYTSDELVSFPGRSFRVKQVLDYNKKTIKKALGGQKANITTRNFPETVAQLRKKFKINDGGENYVFFCTAADGRKIVILTEKV
ncbi:class I SAM-dependent methyltransferase [Robertkochia marina]|uniref:Class I SAM-dependent methyltransferase n=1 Tax=Robertkochia marina TaxID=1227945 RepID=A0A4V3UY19_9FLAO|nr:class I SAM-dependent methyltransferase [Robertkochia marina]THD66744.1 class I SAM-dependent methyltransferase [Robertkochia marina]TRZ42366.1 class I SAM-dependent methyltransferase [Robertkochia marina]